MPRTATKTARKPLAEILPPASPLLALCESSTPFQMPEADLLAAFAALGAVVADRVFTKGDVLSSWNAVTDYLKSKMAFGAVESFRVLFLDKRNRMIADEVMQVGTVDHTPVYPREVIKRALELSATAMILAHNHPSGDATPSRSDIEMTKKLSSIAKELGIAVHDHVIVGRDGCKSFRSMGLI